MIAVILLLYFGISGLWLLNDLMSGMHAAVKATGIEVGTTTGFHSWNYLQTYHIGLWSAMFSLIMLTVFFTIETFRERHD